MIAGSFTRSLAVPATAAFLAGSMLAASKAQSPAPPAAEPSPAITAQHYSDAAVEARIERLHDRLKITAAEEAQWDAVAQIMRANARELEALIEQRDQQAGIMSALDNLRNYQQIADAHADGLKKLVPVFTALYDAMPDTQKATADAIFGRRVRGNRAASAGIQPQ